MSYSLSVRLRRVTTESAHVSVPITADLLIPNPGDEARARINTDRLFEIARAMGKDASTVWQKDGEELVELHPLQTLPDAKQKTS